MRVAESALHGALSFSEIAAEVGLQENEVEVLLFTAMQQGLLEVSIQNANRRVFFRRVSIRSFGRDQWAALEAKLENFQVRVEVRLLRIPGEVEFL